MPRPSDILGTFFIELDGETFCVDCARPVWDKTGHINWHKAGRPGATFDCIEIGEVPNSDEFSIQTDRKGR
jgi:hypothetical protein